MKISIIAAIDEKRGIGKNGQLPWHLPEDLKRFKEITSGHTVIMGRKTFESIGRVLPNRTNIIITRDKDFNPHKFYSSEKCEVLMASSLDEALERAQGDEVFIIGGGQVYAQAILKADKLYLTQVEGDFNCDTFFPDYSSFTNENFIGAGEENGIRYKFLELER
ncbi:dihydrofolate reductase [Patescibacteria group bacterium]|nr:dihydrofolate reductase [Patescibacteria group bacterium]